MISRLAAITLAAGLLAGCENMDTTQQRALSGGAIGAGGGAAIGAIVGGPGAVVGGALIGAGGGAAIGAATTPHQ
jgi:hypothetical protein